MQSQEWCEPPRAPARRGPLSLAAVPSIVVLRGPAGAHRVCGDSANRALLWRRKPLSQRQPTNPVHWVPSARIGQRPGSAPVSQHTPPRARGSAHTLSEGDRLTFICWLADFRAKKAALSDMYTPSVLHMRRCMPRNLRTACSRTAGRDAGGVRRQPRLAARCVTPSRGRRRAAGKQYADTCPWLSTARAHCSQSRSMSSMSMSRDSESLRSASSAPPR